jgi:hypothetical protein
MPNLLTAATIGGTAGCVLGGALGLGAGFFASVFCFDSPRTNTDVCVPVCIGTGIAIGATIGTTAGASIAAAGALIATQGVTAFALSHPVVTGVIIGLCLLKLVGGTDTNTSNEEETFPPFSQEIEEIKETGISDDAPVEFPA